MAEIKVLRPSETRIGPIGIVAMGDGAAAVGRAMRQTGKELRGGYTSAGYQKQCEDAPNETQFGQQRPAKGHVFNIACVCSVRPT